MKDGNRDYRDYEYKTLGVDEARDAEVTLKRCRHCNRLWLRYYIESDGPWNVENGRWAEGLIAEADAEQLTPGLARDYLDRLDWLIVGGSFFGHGGKRRVNCPGDLAHSGL